MTTEKAQSLKNNMKDISDNEYKKKSREASEAFAKELIKNLNKKATK